MITLEKMLESGVHLVAIFCGHLQNILRIFYINVSNNINISKNSELLLKKLT